MCLDDYIQTMTISKPKNSKRIKVEVQLQEIGNMSLHISNLLRGRVIVGEFNLHTLCLCWNLNKKIYNNLALNHFDV